MNNIPWLLVVILILGAVATTFEVLIYIRKSKKVLFLENEFRATYLNIETSLTNSYLSRIEIREVMLDLSELLYEAQNEKRPITDVIGSNVNDFTKAILQSHGHKKKLLYILITGAQTTIFTLFVVQFATFSMRNTRPLFETTIGLPLIPYIIVLSFIILPLIKYLVSNKKRVVSAIASSLLIISFVLLTEFLISQKENSLLIQKYVDTEILLINSQFTASAVILALISLYLLKKHLQRSAIKNIK